MPILEWPFPVAPRLFDPSTPYEERMRIVALRTNHWLSMLG